MLDFLKSLFRPQGSGATAKERLRLVLLSDHLSLAPEMVDELKTDLFALLSRYVEIDSEQAEVTFEQRDREVAMIASIPIRRVLERSTPAPAPVHAVPAPAARPLEDEEPALGAQPAPALAAATPEPAEPATVAAREPADVVGEAAPEPAAESPPAPAAAQQAVAPPLKTSANGTPAGSRARRRRRKNAAANNGGATLPAPETFSQASSSQA